MVREITAEIQRNAPTFEGDLPGRLQIVVGQQGPKGDPGKDGISATHSWEGTILTVSSASGTSSADLVGPPGEPGKPGEPGPAGPQGPPGTVVFEELTDEQLDALRGPKGDKGDTGAAGPAGPAGQDGISATHSWNGTTLIVTSASGTSSANLKGDKGDTGPQGPAGSVAKSKITVTLQTSRWSNNQQTVTASGVTAGNDVIVSPAASSFGEYCDAGCYCTAQSSNSITFQCTNVPSTDLTVNVMILG